MGRNKLTEDEKYKQKIKRDTKNYMKSVREFLKNQNNGEVPFEFECSLLMLETYYSQFLELNYEISKMDRIIVPSRYGDIPSPILHARDTCVAKLDMILKSVGCTFKEQTKMKITEPKTQESPIQAFLKGKIEKR